METSGMEASSLYCDSCKLYSISTPKPARKFSSCSSIFISLIPLLFLVMEWSVPAPLPGCCQRPHKASPHYGRASRAGCCRIVGRCLVLAQPRSYLTCYSNMLVKKRKYITQIACIEFYQKRGRPSLLNSQ